MLSVKETLRKRRQIRIRSRVSGTATKPRLAVFRSNRSIYAQLLDDENGVVMAAVTSMKMKEGKNLKAAKQVGLELAKQAKAKKITDCVFDRGGYLYHGRVKALAEGAREGGLQF